MAEVDINALGDQIANLTLKQAKELSDYIKEKYGIEPAAGGAVMMAGPAGGAAAQPPRLRPLSDGRHPGRRLPDRYLERPETRNRKCPRLLHPLRA